jgi:glycosyltransferase involved in cell wall biosynthesis
MRIIHIIFSLNTGGAETMLVDIINEQIKNEKVTLIIINNEINIELLDQIDKKVKIILLRRKEKSRNPLPFLWLNLILLIKKPDVIHCHHQSIIQMILFKKKSVLTVHGVYLKTNNFKHFKKIFAISNAVKADIENRCNIKPVLVYNGIKVDMIKQKVDYKFDTFLIVQVSRLEHEKKGQHILIEAMNILVNESGNTNISIDFIGEGESQDYLKELVNKYKLQPHINFLGLHDRAYIYEHLKDYNLLVQPSFFEGFGLTIVESIAAKVPVLVSNIEGPMEIIENEKYGCSFKSGDVVSCAVKIYHIYQNYSTYQELAEKAFKICRLKYSIQNTAQNYIDNY